MKKRALALCLLVVLVAPIVLLIQTNSILPNTKAQTTPSIPEFSIKYIDNSIDTPTIVITIKNQPFTSYNNSDGLPVNLLFNVRQKAHSEENWTNLFNSDSPSPVQVGTQDTVLTYEFIGHGLFEFSSTSSPNIAGFVLLYGGQIDFQVQAMIGSFHKDISLNPTEVWVFDGVTSDWSPTQTLSLVAKISFVSPQAGKYDVSNVPLSFVVNFPVSQTTYSLDSQANITVAGNTTLTGLPNGFHNITIWVNDAYGDTGKSETVNFTVAAAPIISFLSLGNRTFETSTVPLNFTFDQWVSKITYCLDGQANVTISGNTTLSGLKNGDHNVTVYATDEQGYVGASETAYFTVAVPFPTAIVVGSIIAVVVIVSGLLVYFKKRKGSLNP